jgi:hypothetical protein
VLSIDDVLLTANGFSIASDGTVLYQGNRVSAALAFHLVQSGETVPLQVWRDGREVKVDLPVSIYEGDRATGYQYDRLPRYFVHGGLVFVALSLDLLRSLGRNVPEAMMNEFYYELFFRRHESPATVRSEPVVLASVLGDEVNANFTVRGPALVDKINAVKVDRMEDVIRAFESNTNAFHVLECQPHGTFETLDRAEVEKANAGILKNYGIQTDRRL